MKKRRIEIAVISDVHLGSTQCRAEELLGYLGSIRPKKLILNGDIIDPGHTVNAYFPPAHLNVLKKIFSMAGEGTEVFYLCANREPVLRKFRGYNLRNFYVKNRLMLILDGKRACFFHGDVFDTTLWASKWIFRFGHTGYRFLSMVNRLVKWIRITNRISAYTYKKEIGNNAKESIEVRRRFEKFTADFAVRNGFEYVVCGHLHKAQKKWIETPFGTTLYLNSGDWVESLTALEFNFSRWKLYHYDKDKLSPFYAAADADLKEMDVGDLISILARGELHETL